LCSSSGAYAGFISKYESEVWASDCFSIHSKNKKVLDEKYLYYYLKSIQANIYKLQTGAAQPHIYPKSIENVKILLPSMEQQIHIIEFYESNQLKMNALENEIKKLKELEKNYISNMFNANLVNTEQIDESDVQNELEEEVVIEIKQKVKKIKKHF
jgi:type I restriction enzyme M protein